MAARPVIIDCDPGHDDAIAILLALASPELDVRAITTVAGNQTLPKVTRNTLRLLTAVDRLDVPVAAGCDRPLVQAPIVAPEIHGESGLDGPAMPEPAFDVVPEHAVDLIIRLLRAAERPITLIPTGPLTNIATVLLKAPDVRGKIEQVCLMGGAMAEGNKTPVGEFNIVVDAEAARVVFESGLPLTMIGLDVTHHAQAGDAELQALQAMGRPVADLVAGLVEFFRSTYKGVFDFDGAPIHDAVAVAQVIRPGIVTTRHLNVVVETRAEFCYGQTVVDVRRVTGRPPNCHVGFGIDRAAFMQMMLDAVRTY